MIALIALVLVIVTGQLSDHRVLFGAIVVSEVASFFIKRLAKMGTAYWPDGQVDHGKSAPGAQQFWALAGLLFFLRIGLFLWLAVVVWF